MRSCWQLAGWAILAAVVGNTVARGQDRATVFPVEVGAQGFHDEQPLLDERWSLPEFMVAPAAFLFQQPPTLDPSTQPSPQTARRTTQRGSIRLASVPNMFGDQGGQVAATMTTILRDAQGQQITQTTQSSASLPLGGGGTRTGKISENDSPIPRDRFFFSYNHFHNVFELRQQRTTPPGPPIIRQLPIDRYTVGGGKTFFDGWTSVEIRMPLQGSLDAQLQTVGINAGSVGNLTVVAKSLVMMDDATTAVGAGIAVETPTGSDTFSRMGTRNLQFRNEALHLLPYIGFVWSPDDPRWGWGDGLFFSGFAQIDIAANGNTVNVLGPGGAVAGNLGRFTEQNLGFLDIGAGYWLYRNPYAPRITGLAVITEVHYTTSLQDTDQINATIQGAQVRINNPDNRFDIVNGTIGVQGLLFDTSSLRVAGVFPIGDEQRRLFDSEVQVQFNRRF